MQQTLSHFPTSIVGNNDYTRDATYMATSTSPPMGCGSPVFPLGGIEGLLSRRRGLVSRWNSRTREAQWEEEQTAKLSGAHWIFKPTTKIGKIILKSKSVLSWWSWLFCSWKGRLGERSRHEINFLSFRNISWKEPLGMELDSFLMTGSEKSNQQKRKPLNIQDPLRKDVPLCDNYSW